MIFGQAGILGMNQASLNEMYIVAALLTALALFQHRENIKRLIKGEERKTILKKTKKDGEIGELSKANADCAKEENSDNVKEESDDTEDILNEVKEEITEIVEEVKEKTEEIIEEVKEEAGEIVEDAKEEIEELKEKITGEDSDGDEGNDNK